MCLNGRRLQILRDCGRFSPVVGLVLAVVPLGMPAQAQAPPTIAVMNTATHTPYKPPINLLYPSTIRLRGGGFMPGAAVTVHLDTRTGANLGMAVPNKSGVFLGNFTLPFTTTSGPHTLVAVQGSMQASKAVMLAAQPR